MYNRYVRTGNAYTRVAVEDRTSPHGDRSRREEGREAQGRESWTRAGSPGPQSARTQSRNGSFPGGGGADLLNLGRLGELFDRDKSGGLGGLLKALRLDSLDSGDVLLLLIILLVLTDGDDLELVITLGLMLLLGLGDAKKKIPDGGKPSG